MLLLGLRARLVATSGRWCASALNRTSRLTRLQRRSVRNSSRLGCCCIYCRELGEFRHFCGCCLVVVRCHALASIDREISRQNRGRSRRELFVNSLLFIDNICVVLFLGGPLIVPCAGLSSLLMLIVVYFSCGRHI